MDRMPKLYLESSVISYLCSRPSRDLIVAANQEITREWWEGKREQYDLYISELVWLEIAAGDPEVSAKRTALVAETPILTETPGVVSLAADMLVAAGLAPSAEADMIHVALSTLYGLDCLLTWNCHHIANAAIRKRLRVCAEAAGYDMPVICTVHELMGEQLP